MFPFKFRPGPTEHCVLDSFAPVHAAGVESGPFKRSAVAGRTSDGLECSSGLLGAKRYEQSFPTLAICDVHVRAIVTFTKTTKRGIGNIRQQYGSSAA